MTILFYNYFNGPQITEYVWKMLLSNFTDRYSAWQSYKN